MRIIFFDTETTGNTDHDRLCQLGVKDRNVPVPIVNATYKPPLPISIGAMAIHHITEKMVAERPVFIEASEYGDIKNLFENSDTVSVAHNAAFDVGMLIREEITPRNFICTYKVARALDPEDKIGQYSLQYLRYFLKLEIDAVAHDAWGDVLVLEGLFNRLFAKMIEEKGSEEETIREMIEISGKPMLFTTLRFGKHMGRRIVDIAREDRGYLKWLLRQKKEKPEGESDWIYTLEHFLNEVNPQE
jgi:exodeoxyribonuclease X